MATLQTFGLHLDLIGSTAVQWKIISTSSSSVILENGLQHLSILGNFAIGPAGDVSGTATAVNLVQLGYSGLPVFQATDLTIDGGTFLDTVLEATTDTQIYTALLAGSDTITGSAGKDILKGFAGSDVIRAGGGDDRIGADAGSDVIDGGAGFDTVAYQGAYADYRIERSGDAWTVADLKGTGGIDTLILALHKLYRATIVMITHDLDLLWQVTDRVAVLCERKVLAVGSMSELSKLDHPTIREYFDGPRGRAAHEQAEEHAASPD